jgi:hypothetical protein
VKRLRVLTAIAVAFFASATTALAQNPTVSGYGGEGGNVQGAGSQGAGILGSGSLPFTGLDVFLLVLAGLFLLVTGFTLKEIANSRR